MDVAEEMDSKDEELRETIKTLWPIQGKAMAFILVPPKEGSDTATAATDDGVDTTALFNFFWTRKADPKNSCCCCCCCCCCCWNKFSKNR